jgi:hypothetical protein
MSMTAFALGNWFVKESAMISPALRAFSGRSAPWWSTGGVKQPMPGAISPAMTQAAGRRYIFNRNFITPAFAEAMQPQLAAGINKFKMSQLPPNIKAMVYSELANPAAKLMHSQGRPGALAAMPRTEPMYTKPPAQPSSANALGDAASNMLYMGTPPWAQDEKSAAWHIGYALIKEAARYVMPPYRRPMPAPRPTARAMPGVRPRSTNAIAPARQEALPAAAHEDPYALGPAHVPATSGRTAGTPVPPAPEPAPSPEWNPTWGGMGVGLPLGLVAGAMQGSEKKDEYGNSVPDIGGQALRFGIAGLVGGAAAGRMLHVAGGGKLLPRIMPEPVVPTMRRN